MTFIFLEKQVRQILTRNYIKLPRGAPAWFVAAPKIVSSPQIRGGPLASGALMWRPRDLTPTPHTPIPQNP